MPKEPTSFLEEIHVQICNLREQESWGLQEISDWLKHEHHIQYSAVSLHRYFSRHKISKKKNIPWDQFDPEQADSRSIIKQLMIEAYKQTQEARQQENSLTWFHSGKICLQAAALLLRHNEHTQPHYTLDDDEVLPRFVIATDYQS